MKLWRIQLHYLPACLLMLTVVTPSHAQTVDAKLQSGIRLTASFHQGNSSATALLILHGFLQTGLSEPINALASNLDQKGYTTLRPTTSLMISSRKQSMPCEAMHTHTVEQDMSEIDYWFKWLQHKGYSRIVMIGFSSTGNFETLQYSENKPSPMLDRLILISLNPVAVDPAEKTRAQALLQKGYSRHGQYPRLYTLGYCRRNYAATLNSYASFARYDEDQVLQLLAGNKLPLNIIFGGNDTILPAEWISRISALHSSAEISVIPNANHFFDGTSEFDLAEAVENILKKETALP